MWKVINGNEGGGWGEWWLYSVFIRSPDLDLVFCWARGRNCIYFFSSASQCFCFLKFLWRPYSWCFYLAKRRSKKGSLASREMAYEMEAGWKEGGGVHQFVEWLSCGVWFLLESSRSGEGLGDARLLGQHIAARYICLILEHARSLRS